VGSAQNFQRGETTKASFEIADLTTFPVRKHEPTAEEGEGRC